MGTEGAGSIVIHTIVPKAGRVLTGLLGLAILYLSLTPDPEQLESGMDLVSWVSTLVFGTPEHGDKVGHFIAYCALGAAATLGFWIKARSVVPIYGGLLVYGGVLEIVQDLGGIRTGDAADMLANTLGAGVGVLAGRTLQAILERMGSST
jgi:hypothetical protein